ncbi:concanavalin A-like lectin/glucanase domain-containing protein [Tuber brumale]|nr:concanavalin A-like lectin/glucanase domain-containing protein [Tuber brumale]
MAMIGGHPEAVVNNWKLFRTAIYNNSVDVVTNILDQGVDPDALNEHGWSPLAIAEQMLKRRAINDVVEVLKSRGAKEFGVPTGEANGKPVIGQPPTLMNRNDTGAIVDVSEDGLELRSLRPESHIHIGSIRANHPIPKGEYTYYFEVELQKVTRLGSDYPMVAIGICTDVAPLEDQLPGWSDLGSISYHGDDGKFFHNGDGSEIYGPTYSAGDVIGCGVDFANDRIFFTKNGEFLGFKSIVTGLVYYPVVGLAEVTVAKVNFGRDPSWPFRGYVLPDGIPNTDEGGDGDGEAGSAPGEEGSQLVGDGEQAGDPPPLAKGEE